MTRWARPGKSNQKKPLSASSWKDLKKSNSQSHKNGASSSKSTNYHNKYPPKYDAKLHGTIFKTDRSRLGPDWKPGDGVLHHDRDSSLEVEWKRPDDSKKPNLAAQLEELKTSVEMTPEDEKEIAVMIKKDKRREKRRVKRINVRQTGLTCYHCREAGHDMSSCPRLEGNMDAGSGICFRCGSAEHSLKQCKLRLPNGNLPYATCFICGEQGHLSKECPDNPKGLYPKGGCCGHCGSVEHYKKDCPEKPRSDGIGDMVLPLLDRGSADAELLTEEIPVAKKKRPKIVKF